MSFIERVKGAFLKADDPVLLRPKGTVSGFEPQGADMNLDQLIDFLNLRGVSRDSLSEATYFACMKVLSEGVAKLPLKLLKSTKDSGVEQAIDHSLYYKVGKRPNRFQTASAFWSDVEFNRNHYGNAYIYIKGAGRSTQLFVIPSEQVTIYVDDALMLSQVKDIYYVYNSPSGQVIYKSEEIIHLRTSHSIDGISGLSVREILSETIQGNVKGQELENQLYESAFTAKAVVQYTGSINDESTKKLVDLITDYAKGGVKKGGSVIPIPMGMQLTPLNTKLADNQFVELRRYTSIQIATAFGIKPNQVGDYTKSSYSSSEAQQLSFYVDTLLYIIKQYEEELTYKLLSDNEVDGGYHFKFNVGVILRADFKSQIETLSKGVSNFILTPNEARDMLDYKHIEGGDQLFGNGATISIDKVGSQYGNNTETDEPADPPDGEEVDDGKEES